MKIQVRPDQGMSMTEVVARLLGGSTLTVCTSNGAKMNIRGFLPQGQSITITHASINSDRQVRMPVRVEELGTEGILTFYFAEKNGEFCPSAKGHDFVIE